MPRILLKESTFDQLQVNVVYTLIIRKHGMIFKQITDDATLSNMFVVKLEPRQVRKFQLQEKNAEYSLFLEFAFEVDQEYSCNFISLELPISVLFDKIMKIIDPYYEERSLLSESTNAEMALTEIQTKNNFLNSFDEFVKKTQSMITQPVAKGIKFIHVGMLELEKTIRIGLQTITAPIIKKEHNNGYTELVQKDFAPVEFLIQINKIYLNHVDSALLLRSENKEGSQNKLLLVEHGEEDPSATSKPTCVFIHPFGLDLTVWTPYMNMLYNKGYRVIAYDMRGWGGSEQHKNDEYRFSDYYNDLLALLDEKNLLKNDQELVLIAGSLSGLMLLNRIDSQLEKRTHMKLILLSSTDCLEKDLQEMIKKIPPPRTWGPLKKIGKSKIKELVFTQNLNVPEEQEKLITKLLSADNKVVMETIKNIRSDTGGLSEKQIKNLPFEKILILSGNRDLFIPLKNLKKFENRENTTIKIIEGGNHFIAYENPELMLKEIFNWL